jgi:hypothetical protein
LKVENRNKKNETQKERKKSATNTRYEQFGDLALGKVGFLFERFGKSENSA